MNKKGFVLTETLAVTVFLVTIFTFVYIAVIPLIGKYRDMALRENDIDIVYKLYNIRKMIEKDANEHSIISSDAKIFNCQNLYNKNYCNKLMNYLELSDYSIIYTKSIKNNLEFFKDNNEIYEYLKQYKDNEEYIIGLYDANNHTIAHINYNNLDASVVLGDKISSSTCIATTEEDGITYFSGREICVNYNYVWYSGKMWRIIAIYPDGKMKLMTNNYVTSIMFGENFDFYKDESNHSYVYDWIKDEFMSTLYNYDSFITDEVKWNVSTPSSSSLQTPLPNTNMIKSKFGLIDAHENYLLCKNTDIHPTSPYTNCYTNFSSGYLIHPVGDGVNNDTYGKGFKPVIVLKSDVKFSSGSGTIDNPFRIKGDRASGKKEDNINSRIIGEYVKFKDNNNAPVYRIMGMEENGTTKLITNYYVDNCESKRPSLTSTYGSGTSDVYWDYYLNNTWFNNLKIENGNLFTTGTYYLGNGAANNNYRESICILSDINKKISECTKTTPYTFNVGLPRFGEMFASPIIDSKSCSRFMWNCNSIWTLTKFNNTNGLRYILYTGELPSYNYNNTYGHTGTVLSARATIHLKSSIKIKSGSGTPTDPYVVGL